MTTRFDLGYYFERFPVAAESRYGRHFSNEFRDIATRFRDVRAGRRLLTVADVIALFSSDLPFVRDWTKPDLDELTRKMEKGTNEVAVLVRDLGDAGNELALLKGIVDCFRELSLAALVLHHVYPARYAIVSHHLASLLHVTGPTVPHFYLEYCKELRIWSTQEWPTPGIGSVADTEFAPWTWYRYAYATTDADQSHRTNFLNDVWVQRRRAERIAVSLGPIGKLDLARSYLRTDPTVAGMIAWRELEILVRDLVDAEPGEKEGFPSLVGRIENVDLPPGLDKRGLRSLWDRRNRVMHEGEELENATALVEGAAKFLGWNS